jgi:site-specific DNA-methyltransferase (adenine-specific)
MLDDGPGAGMVEPPSRFYYVAKVAPGERDAGLPLRPGQRRANPHLTVKPLALMRWCCRLVCPRNGIVLDPFTGSGSTGAAARLEGMRFYGIELEAAFVETARLRVAYWEGKATR